MYTKSKTELKDNWNAPCVTFTIVFSSDRKPVGVNAKLMKRSVTSSRIKPLRRKSGGIEKKSPDAIVICSSKNDSFRAVLRKKN